MIIQELSIDIIEAIREIDTTAQIDMLQMIEAEKSTLTVTHIHQGSQADQMEWPLGELIISANDEEIHSLDELQKIIDNNKNAFVLLECRHGRIGYFKVE